MKKKTVILCPKISKLVNLFGQKNGEEIESIPAKTDDAQKNSGEKMEKWCEKKEKTSLYERFTDRARKVMQLANQEALRLQHECLGTTHILLGLIKEGSGVAANVLKNMDADFRKVRREVEKLVEISPGIDPDFTPTGRLPLTPRSKNVVEYSLEEAKNLQHNYVGTEHVLLGLLREKGGAAVQVLKNLGLWPDDIRHEILRLLGYGLEVKDNFKKVEATIEKSDAEKQGSSKNWLLKQICTFLSSNMLFNRGIAVLLGN